MVWGDGDDSRWDVFQNRFCISSLLFQSLIGILQIPVCLFQFLGTLVKLSSHSIERGNQDAQFVVGGAIHLVEKISLRNFIGGLCQSANGDSNSFGKIQTDPYGCKQNEQSNQPQQEQIIASDDLTISGPGFVIFVGLGDLIGQFENIARDLIGNNDVGKRL